MDERDTRHASCAHLPEHIDRAFLARSRLSSTDAPHLGVIGFGDELRVGRHDVDGVVQVRDVTVGLDADERTDLRATLRFRFRGGPPRLLTKRQIKGARTP
jgi:hypothetical protein